MITYPILRLYLEGETIEFKNEDIIEATVVQEITNVGGSIEVATVQDPFGNYIGFISGN